MGKWIPALRITGIGFYIATCIVGGTLAGWWLGGKRPLFMIIGLVAGLVIAVYGVYRMIKPLLKNNQNEEHG
ncbi:MAG: AtpZ/AtpI family protein [Dehalococcoidales bacterium]|jgi:F0F1-type ATP synthase assembly protein I